MRIGVISFSTMARMDIDLGQFTDNSKLLKAIWEMEFMAGKTNTAEAIEMMQHMFNQ